MPPQEAEDQPPPSHRSRAQAATIELHVENACAALSPISLQQLITDTRRVLALLPNTGSVRVRIVDDAEMIEAHKRYCDLDTTTDVLTFDLASHDTDFQSKALDTDLIVCADEANRQALRRDHPVTHELLLYIIHGVLHCLGHDDHDDDAFARMHAREDQLLTDAGIGPVFSADLKEERRS
jgi:probable rRNA maturation factor